MRITCEGCGKVYVLEERLRGRAFRMRCKRCDRLIAFQPGGATDTPGEAVAGAIASGEAPAPGATPDPDPASRWEADDAFSDLARDLQEAIDAPTPSPTPIGARLAAIRTPPPAALDARPAVATASPVASGVAEAAARPSDPVAAAPPVLLVDPTARRSWRRRVAGVVAVLAVVGSGAGFLALRERAPAPAPESGRAPPAGVAAAAVAPAPAAGPGVAEPAAAPPAADPPPPVASAPASSPAPPPPERKPGQKEAAPRPPQRLAAARSGASSHPPAAAPAPGAGSPPVSAAPAPVATTPASPAPSRVDLPPRDARDAEALLAGSTAGFDACLADARRNEPYLLAAPRTVVLTMTVRPSGQAAYPTLDDAQLSGTALGACIKRRGAAIAFPEAGGEPVRIRTTLVLGP